MIYQSVTTTITSDGSGNSADVEATSIQVSYTMGGATINIAEASMDNAK